CSRMRVSASAMAASSFSAQRQSRAAPSSKAQEWRHEFRSPGDQNLEHRPRKAELNQCRHSITSNGNASAKTSSAALTKTARRLPKAPPTSPPDTTRKTQAKKADQPKHAPPNC